MAGPVPNVNVTCKCPCVFGKGNATFTEAAEEGKGAGGCLSALLARCCGGERGADISSLLDDRIKPCAIEHFGSGLPPRVASKVAAFAAAVFQRGLEEIQSTPIADVVEAFPEEDRELLGLFLAKEYSKGGVPGNHDIAVRFAEMHMQILESLRPLVDRYVEAARAYISVESVEETGSEEGGGAGSLEVAPDAATESGGGGAAAEPSEAVLDVVAIHGVAGASAVEWRRTKGVGSMTAAEMKVFVEGLKKRLTGIEAVSPSRVAQAALLALRGSGVLPIPVRWDEVRGRVDFRKETALTPDEYVVIVRAILADAAHQRDLRIGRPKDEGKGSGAAMEVKLSSAAGTGL